MRKGEPAMKAINNRDYSTLIAAATQKIPCDLTVKNVKLVNVLTGEIYPASVDVKDGVIVHVQPGEACDSQSKTTVDGRENTCCRALWKSICMWNPPCLRPSALAGRLCCMERPAP